VNGNGVSPDGCRKEPALVAFVIIGPAEGGTRPLRARPLEPVGGGAYRGCADRSRSVPERSLSPTSPVTAPVRPFNAIPRTVLQNGVAKKDRRDTHPVSTIDLIKRFCIFCFRSSLYSRFP
jgi:hypothetical protein